MSLVFAVQSVASAANETLDIAPLHFGDLTALPEPIQFCQQDVLGGDKWRGRPRVFAGSQEDGPIRFLGAERKGAGGEEIEFVVNRGSPNAVLAQEPPTA
jgi:hypothetical protein